MFKEDFVKRTLHMHAMNSIWLDACVFMLDGLCASRGNADLCSLFVAKVFALSPANFTNKKKKKKNMKLEFNAYHSTFLFHPINLDAHINL